jgi:hypothetical protein
MLTLKRLDCPLTMDALNDLGRDYPVVYVFSEWPGIDAALARAIGEGEAGEVAVIARFDASSEFCQRHGLKTARSMIAFAINTPYSGAENPDDYLAAVQDARRWRHLNQDAERRGWASPRGSL